MYELLFDSTLLIFSACKLADAYLPKKCLIIIIVLHYYVLFLSFVGFYLIDK